MARQTPNDLSAVEDTYLATQTKAGNDAAFRQLFDKHYKWVYNKAYRYLGNYQDTEEVASDVFIKVWQKLGKNKWDAEKGSFQAWLNTVAQNTIIDAVRKRNRNREHPLSGSPDEDEQPLSEYEDSYSGPEQELEAVEAQQILESALEQVKKSNHRIAWMLRHLEGYSIAEIARILNQKEGTVKIWIFRCTKELRDILVAKGIQWIY